MFDSGISVKNLVSELINEVDIALQIPNATYVSWLNSLQHILYTEVIKEQKRAVLLGTITPNPFAPTAIKVGNDESTPRFEDIYAVYADGKQLMKSTPTSGVIFPDTFYKDNNHVGYNTKKMPAELTVVYIIKPALVTVTEDDEINDANVMIPIEFIDLVKSKLRGEAYKLANEGELASMWLNDYNVLLETFKSWIANKSPNFGM